MPIDLAQVLGQVDWFYVIVLALLVFVAALIGNALAFGSRFVAAVLSAVVFAGFFVALTYYPHHLPLPTAPVGQKSTTPAPPPPAPPAQTPTQRRPSNPITDITPPPSPGTPTPAR